MGSLVELTTGIRSQLVIASYSNWLKRNERILDVGCGDGILSSILQKRFSLQLTGCDIDRYLTKNITFVRQKGISALPFPDNSFDAVMFNDTLHHTTFANQKKLIKEALRVSPKVLIFEDEPTLIGSITDWSINKFHNIHMPITLAFRGHDEWTKLFADLGVTSEFKSVRKPLLYPFTHEAFFVVRESRK